MKITYRKTTEDNAIKVIATADGLPEIQGVAVQHYQGEVPKPVNDLHKIHLKRVENELQVDARKSLLLELERVRRVTDANHANEMAELLTAFEYIEKVRYYSTNAGKVPKLKREARADLYFAGKAIMGIVKAKGSAKHIQELNRIIDQYPYEIGGVKS